MNLVYNTELDHRNSMDGRSRKLCLEIPSYQSIAALVPASFSLPSVVSRTPNGVNDAPALSAAQCGVAVDDATDAAKNAAAIILTSPGLSAIYR